MILTIKADGHRYALSIITHSSHFRASSKTLKHTRMVTATHRVKDTARNRRLVSYFERQDRLTEQALRSQFHQFPSSPRDEPTPSPLSSTTFFNQHKLDPSGIITFTIRSPHEIMTNFHNSSNPSAAAEDKTTLSKNQPASTLEPDAMNLLIIERMLRGTCTLPLPSLHISPADIQIAPTPTPDAIQNCSPRPTHPIHKYEYNISAPDKAAEYISSNEDDLASIQQLRGLVTRFASTQIAHAYQHSCEQSKYSQPTQVSSAHLINQQATDLAAIINELRWQLVLSRFNHTQTNCGHELARFHNQLKDSTNVTLEVKPDPTCESSSPDSCLISIADPYTLQFANLRSTRCYFPGSITLDIRNPLNQTQQQLYRSRYDQILIFGAMTTLSALLNAGSITMVSNVIQKRSIWHDLRKAFVHYVHNLFRFQLRTYHSFKKLTHSVNSAQYFSARTLRQ